MKVAMKARRNMRYRGPIESFKMNADRMGINQDMQQLYELLEQKRTAIKNLQSDIRYGNDVFGKDRIPGNEAAAERITQLYRHIDRLKGELLNG